MGLLNARIKHKLLVEILRREKGLRSGGQAACGVGSLQLLSGMLLSMKARLQ